ncbi:MAG: hypothetical protein J4F37_04260 [Acidobacteria bacterium]|nr:hypothetical protein [Acidobacteriota bacterium]
MMTTQRIIAAALVAVLVLPAAAAAQQMTPAREALRQAGHDLPTPAEREEQRRRDATNQRLWSAALIGAGGAAGWAVGFSDNEWPIDEGWWGVGIAGTALGFGLFGLLDPMEWGEVEVQPQGLASRRPAGSGSGLARGAALSLSW